MNYPGMDYLVETINKQAIVGGVIAPGMIGALAGNMLSWKINKNKGPSWHTKPLTYGLGALGALSVPIAIMISHAHAKKNDAEQDYSKYNDLPDGRLYGNLVDILNSQKEQQALAKTIESNMNIGEELDYE